MHSKTYNRVINKGISLHKAGCYQDAQAAYRQALKITPNNSQLLRLYGLSYYQQGAFDKAIEIYNLALKTQPDNAEAWRNLGLAFKSIGNYEKAIEAYQNAIRWRRDYAEAFRNLGNVFVELKRIDEARVAYEEALRLKPNYAEAYTNLGMVLEKQEKIDEAIDAHKKAVTLLPQWFPAHNNLGQIYLNRGQFETAISHFNKAIALNNKYAIAWSNLGLAFAALGQVSKAEKALKQACKLDKKSISCQTNLGIFLQQHGKYQEALVAYKHLINLRPEKIDPYFNIASIYNASGKTQAALQILRDGIVAAPKDSDAHFALSLSLLQNGHYKEGFAEYEWRRKREDHVERNYEIPEWNGEDLRDKSILLYPEQGMGDMVQFVRFASLLQEKGAYVHLETYPVLRKLFTHSFPQLPVYSSEDKPINFDYHCPLMSVPAKLGLELSDITGAAYLSALPQKIDMWRPFFLTDQFKIGIVWQGNPAGAVDRGRSIPLQFFKPLAQLPNVQLVSLQKNFGLDQLSNLSHEMDIMCMPEEFDKGDDAFLDTIAVMQCLDLIVTSDTSIAHLGGASGCPTWVVLKHVPDWRWGFQGSISPWYDSVKLFRQVKTGDWSIPFQAIADSLTSEQCLQRASLNK
jgi:tetratricopeptide (TPR) repeat protein